MCAESLQSCPVLSDPHEPQFSRLLCPWDSPGKNTGVGCHALLQGIFPTQGSNLSLLTSPAWGGGDRELGEKTSTYHEVQHCVGLRGGSGDGESAHNAGDLGLILGWGRSPGEGNGHPLQCSCLENPMDRSLVGYGQ